jgi:hypothetical protein
MAEYPPFKPGSYNTPLSPLHELLFRDWVQKNNVPFNLNTQGATDYDMRGYWQGLQSGHPMARPSEIDPYDQRPHYTDYYKNPGHPSFSRESQWGGPADPTWINDHQLAAPSGRILKDVSQEAVSPVLRALMGLK